MLKFILRLFNLLYRIKLLFVPHYFGFIQGHAYLDTKLTSRLHELIYEENESLVCEYERQFSDLNGGGLSVSFASGRMAFYALMKVLGLGKNDEVIINGATCAVMVNAVLRIGARPVFSDIDPETLGSSKLEIQKCISPQTKLVVAQHSFGIPCDVDGISELCAQQKIFLLEDCALAIGSTLHGQLVGSFGDAAIFSTDHTKPLNTFVGGLLYTKILDIHLKVNEIRHKSHSLSYMKKKAMLRRIMIESKHTKPNNYGAFQIIDTINLYLAKINGSLSPYLDKDFDSRTVHKDYPYPAKLPSFLALLGILELQRWENTAEERKINLKTYISFFIKNNISNKLPSAYFDSSRHIIPLRVAWSSQDGNLLKNNIRNFIQTSWIWFTEPIISTTVPLSKLNYKNGDCPISEKIGENIINLPTSISPSEVNIILSKLEKII
jgi:perosamine synthetase